MVLVVPTTGQTLEAMVWSLQRVADVMSLDFMSRESDARNEDRYCGSYGFVYRSPLAPRTDIVKFQEGFQAANQQDIGGQIGKDATLMPSLTVPTIFSFLKEICVVLSEYGVFAECLASIIRVTSYALELGLIVMIVSYYYRSSLFSRRPEPV